LGKKRVITAIMGQSEQFAVSAIVIIIFAAVAWKNAPGSLAKTIIKVRLVAVPLNKLTTTWVTCPD